MTNVATGSVKAASPILLIDTSIIGVSMAFSDASFETSEKNIIWKKIHPENMGSVPAIGSMLQEGLEQCSWAFDDIKGVCVSSGPGSFTGIKVGLAFSFGLKLARDGGIPMLGVSALELACSVLAAERKDPGLRVFLPATKTHGFMAKIEGGKVTSQLFDVGSPEGAQELGTCSNDSTKLIFRDWPLLTALLGGSSSQGKSYEIIDEIRMCNAAVYGMAEAAQNNWPHGFLNENPEPRYLRLSTAEEKLIADTRIPINEKT